jgi:hypothetical protein
VSDPKSADESIPVIASTDTVASPIENQEVGTERSQSSLHSGGLKDPRPARPAEASKPKSKDESAHGPEIIHPITAPIEADVVAAKESQTAISAPGQKTFRLGRFNFNFASEPKPDRIPQVHVQVPEIISSPWEDEASAPTQSASTLSAEGKKNLRKVISIGVAVLVVIGFFLISNANRNSDTSQILGKVALSETELHDLVIAKHLTVYWAGPLAGAKYTLSANTKGVAVLKYLPGGVGLNDTKTLFRAIGTYAQKSAFGIARNTGAGPGNTGFINADGNAVFYTSSRPTNVYIGIKGKDVQVEVFDPGVDQAIGLVLIRNQIRQIV